MKTMNEKRNEKMKENEERAEGGDSDEKKENNRKRGRKSIYREKRNM